MPEIELEIDVAVAAGLDGSAKIGATIVLPDPADLPERPILCFARPSSSYARAYYTQPMPGPGGGESQAMWHARRGWIFAALDTLGCVGPDHPDLDQLTFATLAAAAHAAEREIALRLANGVLAHGYPPVGIGATIGLGHSLGAALAIYQQARHRSYDGLGILGFSAIHSQPPTPPGGPPVVVAWYPRDADAGETEPLNAAALDAAVAAGLQDDAAWRSLSWGFHYDDVPAAIVEDDLRHYARVGVQGAVAPGERRAWHAHRTTPRAARATLTPGIVAAEAAWISVPVLSAMGVRDLVPDCHAEPRAFRSSRSVDLFVCPRMGHVHNMAGTRSLLWRRIDAFGSWCAALKADR